MFIIIQLTTLRNITVTPIAFPINVAPWFRVIVGVSTKVLVLRWKIFCIVSETPILAFISISIFRPCAIIFHTIFCPQTSSCEIHKTKRRRSDQVLWQKPLHLNVKRAVTTQTTPQKSSIKQRLRTDLGRSVGVTTATQLVWFTGFRAHLPTHRNSYVIEDKNKQRFLCSDNKIVYI